MDIDIDIDMDINIDIDMDIDINMDIDMETDNNVYTLEERDVDDNEEGMIWDGQLFFTIVCQRGQWKGGSPVVFISQLKEEVSRKIFLKWIYTRKRAGQLTP